MGAQIFTLGLVVSENYIVVKGGVGQVLAMVTVDELLFAQKVCPRRPVSPAGYLDTLDGSRRPDSNFSCSGYAAL